MTIAISIDYAMYSVAMRVICSLLKAIDSSLLIDIIMIIRLDN